MIINEKCINSYGHEVYRNELGVAKEDTFGAIWEYQGGIINISFDKPVFIIFLVESDTVLVFPNKIKNILYIYNGTGDLVKEVLSPNIDKDEKGSEFVYPQVNKAGYLFGFVVSQNGVEYEIGFNLRDMSLGLSKKIRM